MRDDSPVKRPDRLVLLFVFAILLGYFALVVFPTIENHQQERPPLLTPEDIIGVGRQDLEHEDLVSRIREDLKIPKIIEIKILLGPYRYVSGEGRLIDSLNPLAFIMLLDRDFYQELTPEEKIALIAHELGHLTNKPVLTRDLNTDIQFQIEADTYATKYTSPEAMINLLNKADARHSGIKSEEHDLRIQNLEKIKRDRQAH